MKKFICPECGCEGAHYCTGKKSKLINEQNAWFNNKEEQKCLHTTCTQCGGTGVKKSDGSVCVHYISCPCRRCTPSF